MEKICERINAKLHLKRIYQEIRFNNKKLSIFNLHFKKNVHTENVNTNANPIQTNNSDQNKPQTLMTNSQMMEKLKNISVYKRTMPKLGIPFSSRKSQEMLKQCIEDGSAHSYFQIADQFQTQADPSYCGPTTMISVFNSLGVDPKKKWKGIWRWYLEDVIKCLNLEKTRDYGMTMEEFCIVSKCNGVFTEAFRPELEEEKTEKEIIQRIEELKLTINGGYKFIKEKELYQYINKNQIIIHDSKNSECKTAVEGPHPHSTPVKKGNFDFFKTAVYAATRRENFFLVANTSRKALKQTGDGHFSPVVAFHQKSDQLLLLDAARFKYHSMWFNLEQIYNSFKNIDKSTNFTRGFILCSRYYYHCPRICKISLDLDSSRLLRDVINKIYSISSIKTFEAYLDSFIENIHLLNDFKIKSQLLYYNNDLENRSSFHLDEEHSKEFIKYANDNVDITKEIIFENIKDIVYQYLDLIASKMGNKDLKDFLKFCFYLDQVHFIEMFFFFILASHPGDGDSARLMLKNKVLQKEMRVFKDCVGL